MKRIIIVFISLMLISSWCDDDNGPDNGDNGDLGGCEVNWTKHTGNPVMVPGATGEWDDQYVYVGSVIYYEGIYHMWYHGGTNPDSSITRIGYATSPDGLNWTKDQNNPILNVGPDGSWEGFSVYAPTVLLINSEFHMWYVGIQTPPGVYPSSRIGYATSPDGLNWTKDLNNPVLDLGPDGSFDDTWISYPSVIHDGSKYHMWYSGDGGLGTKTQIGHATSVDGVNWTRDPLNPVLSCTTVGWDYDMAVYPTVIFDGNIYHMWYGGGLQYAWRIGYATSEDGSEWTKSRYNPVLSFGSTGSWEESAVTSCDVIKSGEKYLMWYTGGSTITSTASVGYAESDVCTTGN